MISFNNKIMRRCPLTTNNYTQNEASEYLADLSEGKMLRRMEVKGSDYLRPFARIQEIIAVVTATEATSTVEYNVPRS